MIPSASTIFLLSVLSTVRFIRYRFMRQQQQYPPQYTSSYSTNERLVCHVRQIEIPRWRFLAPSAWDLGLGCLQNCHLFLALQWERCLIARVHILIWNKFDHHYYQFITQISELQQYHCTRRASHQHRFKRLRRWSSEREASFTLLDGLHPSNQLHRVCLVAAPTCHPSSSHAGMLCAKSNTRSSSQPDCVPSFGFPSRGSARVLHCLFS